MAKSNTRNDMLNEVDTAIQYMTNKIKTDIQHEINDKKELKRLKQLKTDLKWFKSEY